MVAGRPRGQARVLRPPQARLALAPQAPLCTPCQPHLPCPIPCSLLTGAVVPGAGARAEAPSQLPPSGRPSGLATLHFSQSKPGGISRNGEQHLMRPDFKEPSLNILDSHVSHTWLSCTYFTSCGIFCVNVGCVFSAQTSILNPHYCIHITFQIFIQVFQAAQADDDQRNNHTHMLKLQMPSNTLQTQSCLAFCTLHFSRSPGADSGSSSL